MIGNMSIDFRILSNREFLEQKELCRGNYNRFFVTDDAAELSKQYFYLRKRLESIYNYRLEKLFESE